MKCIIHLARASSEKRERENLNCYGHTETAERKTFYYFLLKKKLKLYNTPTKIKGFFSLAALNMCVCV